MFSNKSLGTKYRLEGYTPKKPIIIIPGLCSSCLKVVDSPTQEWIGKRIWLSMSSIGFDKMWDTIPLLGRPKKKAEDAEEAIKRRWISHMVMQDDGVTDPEGIKLRPVKGIKGCAYLDPGAITNALSYVMGPLAETLEDLGYVEGYNLNACPYDWRVAPYRLEERDSYFTDLQLMIEEMVKNTGSKVVLIAHSLGNRVTHYFSRWVERKMGRQWWTDHVDNWLALGPLWLGAPKLLRAMVTGDRMGLDAFLFEDEGIALARSLGSGPWMFPYITVDHEFQTYSQLKNDKTGKYEDKTNGEILVAGGADIVYQKYLKYYEQDPLIGMQDRVLAPPPVDRIFAIYGINLKTETFFFFRQKKKGKKNEIELDPDGSKPNFKCENGVAFETKDTRQNCLRGVKRGGDGMVPYASLSYCRKWSKDIEIKIAEIEGGEHREILKNKTFVQLVIEYCAQPPPPTVLPSNFVDIEFDITLDVKGRMVNKTLFLDAEFIRINTTPKEIREPYERVSNIQTDDNGNGVVIDFDSVIKTVSFNSSRFQAIVNEIASRCRFIQDSKNRFNDSRNDYGQTALHLAAIDGALEECIEILKGPTDINASDLNGYTPLMYAAQKSHLDVVIFLLQSSDIDVNRQAYNGMSVLHELAKFKSDNVREQSKWLSVMSILHSKCVEYEIQAELGETPLHQAVKRNNVEATRVLVTNGANTNSLNLASETPLHYAVRLGNKQILELLLQNGADRYIETRGALSPLTLAKQTNQEVMVFIRDFNVNFSDKKNNTSVRDSAAALILEDGIGQTALHVAAYEDRLDQVFNLIVQGLSVNAADKHGWTPLHCAASQGNLDVLLVLLNCHGASINVATNNGTTALHYLMRHKFEGNQLHTYLNVLDRFHVKGVVINYATQRGVTALHEACMHGNIEAVKWLLEHNAKINVQTGSGDTPLHFAVSSRSRAIVELLIDNGADSSKTSSADGSVLDLARKVDSSLADFIAQKCSSSSASAFSPAAPSRGGGARPAGDSFGSSSSPVPPRKSTVKTVRRAAYSIILTPNTLPPELQKRSNRTVDQSGPSPVRSSPVPTPPSPSTKRTQSPTPATQATGARRPPAAASVALASSSPAPGRKIGPGSGSGPVPAPAPRMGAGSSGGVRAAPVESEIDEEDFVYDADDSESSDDLLPLSMRRRSVMQPDRSNRQMTVIFSKKPLGNATGSTRPAPPSVRSSPAQALCSSSSSSGGAGRGLGPGRGSVRGPAPSRTSGGSQTPVDPTPTMPRSPPSAPAMPKQQPPRKISGGSNLSGSVPPTGSGRPSPQSPSPSPSPQGPSPVPKPKLSRSNEGSNSHLPDHSVPPPMPQSRGGGGAGGGGPPRGAKRGGRGGSPGPGSGGPRPGLPSGGSSPSLSTTSSSSSSSSPAVVPGARVSANLAIQTIGSLGGRQLSLQDCSNVKTEVICVDDEDMPSGFSSGSAAVVPRSGPPRGSTRGSVLRRGS